MSASCPICGTRLGPKRPGTPGGHQPGTKRCKALAATNRQLEAGWVQVEGHRSVRLREMGVPIRYEHGYIKSTSYISSTSYGPSTRGYGTCAYVPEYADALFKHLVESERVPNTAFTSGRVPDWQRRQERFQAAFDALTFNEEMRNAFMSVLALSREAQVSTTRAAKQWLKEHGL